MAHRITQFAVARAQDRLAATFTAIDSNPRALFRLILRIPAPDGQVGLTKTATWLVLSDVNGDRSHPAHGSSSSKPESLVINKSSEGHTYR